MSLFDWIVFECPSCGGVVRGQSKGGPCFMTEYDAVEVPVAVAGDCIGDRVECDDCEEKFYIKSPRTHLLLRLTKEPPEEE